MTTSIEKTKDLLRSSDSSQVATLKQFKAWTNRIKFFLPSMVVGKGDDDAKFKVALTLTWSRNDRELFENEFKQIFDEKFDYDGYESCGYEVKFFYNPLKKN